MQARRDIPRDREFDGSLALLREGYGYTQRRFIRNASPIFSTRLLLEPVIYMKGPQAAQKFYDPALFFRRGVMPARVRKTLIGTGGVQELDANRHYMRKELFLHSMTTARRDGFLQLLNEYLKEAVRQWQYQPQLEFFHAIAQVLCRAACAWVGVPLAPDEAALRARQFTAMVDGFGAFGPRHWRGRAARRQVERWLAGLVEAARAGNLAMPPDTPFAATIGFDDPQNGRLSTPVAVVEIMNFLRPIVAIATYLSFAMHALATHPAQRAKLDNPAWLRAFVHEVRRYYPFTPFVAARVRHGFTWKGYHFPKNRRVVLDIYAMHHDAALWRNPSLFDPSRFLTKEITPFNFMPQGGGDFEHGHRCAGERLTIDAMLTVLHYMLHAVRFDFAPQSLAIDLTRIPTRPQSGMVLERIAFR